LAALRTIPPKTIGQVVGLSRKEAFAYAAATPYGITSIGPGRPRALPEEREASDSHKGFERRLEGFLEGKPDDAPVRYEIHRPVIPVYHACFERRLEGFLEGKPDDAPANWTTYR
jgi:hypothetical protein